MGGGTGSQQYKNSKRILRELLLYAAAPVAIGVGLAITFFPWLMLLIAVIAALVAKVTRPSK